MFSLLQSLLQCYQAQQFDIRALEAWLLFNLQAILSSGDSSAIRVANELDASLVELAEGLVDEETFASRIGKLLWELDTISLGSEVSTSSVGTSIGSAAATIRKGLEDLGRVADHRVSLVG